MYNKSQKIKKQNTENLKDFSTYKKLCFLTKPRAILSIVFIEDKNDPWFIYVKYFKKTGEITDSSIIIKSDYNDWINLLKNVGWIITNNI